MLVQRYLESRTDDLPALFIGHALWGFPGVEISQALADICSFLFAVPVVLHTLKAMDHQPIAR